MEDDNKTIQHNSEIIRQNHIKTKNEINEKFLTKPKLVSEVYNQSHFRNRSVYVFNFATMRMQTIKVSANILKCVKYASFIGNNNLITVGEMWSDAGIFIQSVRSDKLYQIKKLPINQNFIYTVYQENYLYAISENGSCKYNEELSKVHKIPNLTFEYIIPAYI